MNQHPQPGVLESDPPVKRDPWAALEALLQKLGETSSTTQSVACAVEAARAGVGADVAFWFSKANGKVSAWSGPKAYPPDAAAALAKALLSRVPAGSESMRWVKPDRAAGQNMPEAAVLACDNRTQGSLVVLSFDPHRPFDEADRKAVGLALKIVLAQRAQTLASTKALLHGLLQSLTTIIDAKDHCTAGHSERVARITLLLVRQMGLPAAVEADAYLAGLLHDVGNIALRDEVLQKPKKLTAEETAEVRRHTLVGEQIVASIRPFDRLRPVVRHHHEHFNGGGYPDGLAGDAIPQLARVIAVAEACDAMMSPRRYRAARSPFEIDAVFTAEAGGQFDPEVVRAFMAVRHDIYPPIYQKGIGESAFHAIESMVVDAADGSAVSPVLDD